MIKHLLLTLILMSQLSAAKINSTQMLLVTSEDWSSNNGYLQRYERATVHSSWKKIGAAVPVFLGVNGMGWGIGLHGKNLTDDPQVFEGAKRSPVGIYKISLVLDGKKVTPTVVCPNDPKSKYYNHIVDTQEVIADWRGAENLCQLYQTAIFIEHNYPRAISGRGSCFFIHADNAPTLGCTALPSKDLQEIMLWLDVKQNPVLVQIPKPIYHKFKTSWQLP